MVFDYSTDAVYPSMVYTPGALPYGDSSWTCWIFLVQGGDRQFPALGDYTATRRFQQLDVGLLWFAPSTAYIRDWGTAIGSANIRLR